MRSRGAGAGPLRRTLSGKGVTTRAASSAAFLLSRTVLALPPPIVILGFGMGLFGVPINSVTIVTVNTCIGIGIDYAIHFTAGYLYVRGEHPDRVSALLETARRKGSVIVFNTLVVGIGFAVLMFSSFPPIRHFGIFVFASMVASCAFALVFLPALYSRFGVGGRGVDL